MHNKVNTLDVARQSILHMPPSAVPPYKTWLEQLHDYHHPKAQDLNIPQPKKCDTTPGMFARLKKAIEILRERKEVYRTDLAKELGLSEKQMCALLYKMQRLGIYRRRTEYRADGCNTIIIYAGEAV